MPWGRLCHPLSSPGLPIPFFAQPGSNIGWSSFSHALCFKLHPPPTLLFLWMVSLLSLSIKLLISPGVNLSVKGKADEGEITLTFLNGFSWVWAGHSRALFVKVLSDSLILHYPSWSHCCEQPHYSKGPSSMCNFRQQTLIVPSPTACLPATGLRFKVAVSRTIETMMKDLEYVTTPCRWHATCNSI